MPLTVLANQVLQQPTLRLLIDQGGEHFATEDLYPGGTLGGEWERRIIGEPTFTILTVADGVVGMAIDAITYRLSNDDGHFNDYFTTEKRKTPVHVHLFDLATGELQQDFFVGEVSQPTFDRTTATFVARTSDPAGLSTKIPVSRVALQQFPTTLKDGAIVALGMGVGRRIPLRHLRERQAGEPPESYEYVVATGNVGIDVLYENDGQDHVIVTRVQDEKADSGVDMFPDPIVIWESIPRTYKIDGRYVYAIRFNQSHRGREITADLQRVYPDFDDDVLDEWKWKGDFDGELGCDGVGHGTGTNPPPPAGAIAFPATASLAFSATVRSAAPPPSSRPGGYHYWLPSIQPGFVPYRALNHISQALVTGQSFTAGQLYAIPYFTGVGRTLAQLGAQVSTASTSGGKGQMAYGIYAPKGAGNMYPGALLYDGGVISTEATGTYFVFPNFIEAAESVYYIVFISDWKTGSAAAFLGVPVSGMEQVILGWDPAGNTGYGLKVAYSAYGTGAINPTLPLTFPAGAVNVGWSGNAPALLCAWT